jgi:hypothetical protein
VCFLSLSVHVLLSRSLSLDARARGTAVRNLPSSPSFIPFLSSYLPPSPYLGRHSHLAAATLATVLNAARLQYEASSESVWSVILGLMAHHYPRYSGTGHLIHLQVCAVLGAIQQ